VCVLSSLSGCLSGKPDRKICVLETKIRSLCSNCFLAPKTASYLRCNLNSGQRSFIAHIAARLFLQPIFHPTAWDVLSTEILFWTISPDSGRLASNAPQPLFTKNVDQTRLTSIRTAIYSHPMASMHHLCLLKRALTAWLQNYGHLAYSCLSESLKPSNCLPRLILAQNTSALALTFRHSFCELSSLFGILSHLAPSQDLSASLSPVLARC